MAKGKAVIGNADAKQAAPSHGKKRGVGQADARSFTSFGDVGGPAGDALMGHGSISGGKGPSVPGSPKGSK